MGKLELVGIDAVVGHQQPAGRPLLDLAAAEALSGSFES
jgi:hypothetical protein